MRTVRCDFCGSSNSIDLYQLKDWITKTPGVFQLVRCQSCNLLYLNPRPTWEELQGYYPEDYHPYRVYAKNAEYNLLQKARDVVWKRRAKAVLGYQPKGGRLLDVGCATGEFLFEIERQGVWECYGVEPVTFAAFIAKQETHAYIKEGTLQECAYSDQFFDVVTAWDVLEHTDNPNNTLREIFRILRPGGVLVLRIPDPDSYTARLFKSYWIGFDAPRHLFGFPRSFVIRSLEELGFNIREVRFLSSEHFTVFASMSAFLYDKGFFLLARLSEKVAYSTLARIIFSPAFHLLRFLGMGSAPVYFATKRNLNSTVES